MKAMLQIQGMKGKILPLMPQIQNVIGGENNLVHIRQAPCLEEREIKAKIDTLHPRAPSMGWQDLLRPPHPQQEMLYFLSND